MRRGGRRQPRTEPRVRSQPRGPRTAPAGDHDYERAPTEDQWRPVEPELLTELGDFIDGCSYGIPFVDCVRVQRRARARWGLPWEPSDKQIDVLLKVMGRSAAGPPRFLS